MKLTGLTALACAAMFTVACAGDGRGDRDGDELNRSAATGTSGAETTQSAGFDNDDDANDGAGLMVGTSGQAGASGQVRAQGEAHGASGDARHFVQTISMHNTAEIQLAQLAVGRAQSSDVKAFAQMMIRDHTKAGNELKQAVSGQNVDMTAGQMDQKHETLMARLRTLRGAEFDREYMKAMVEGHKQVSSMLEGRAHMQQSTRAGNRTATGTSGTGSNTAGTTGTGMAKGTAGASGARLDTSVNQWASKTLPTVEQHLQRAEQIHAKVEGSANNAR